MSKPRLAAVAWMAVAAIVLVYAPMAVEYTWRLFGDGPGLWDHAFSGVVGEEHAMGEDSIHHEQQAVYHQHRWVLLAHTTLGGTAIALFVFQLSTRSRRRPVVHRSVGRVAALLAVVSMLGAIAFLVLVGPAGTFDGAAFHLQLWALALGTLTGTAAGIAAIRHRQVAVHRVFMTYAFALLCTAPFLRVLYLVLGAAWPEVTQEVTNLAGGAILGVWAPLAAVLASRTMPVARQRDHLTPLPGAGLETGVGAAAVVAALGLGVAYAASFEGIDRITVTGAVAVLAGLACTALNRRAAAAVMGPAYEEWRIHHLAMLAALPTTALLWAVYAVPFTSEAAFYGALLTGPPAALTAGLWLVAWRRRAPVRSTPRPRALGQPTR